MTNNNKHSAYNIGAMQYDAQRRVYEMQRRAQMAVSGAQSGYKQPPVKNEPYNRRPSQYKDAQTYIPERLPLRSEETSEKILEYTKFEPEPKVERLPMLEQLEKDPERVLLLALILLLSSQNCDPMLLLALLYII